MTEKEKRTEYWHKRYMDKMHKIHSRQIEARKQHFVNGGTLIDFVPKFSSDDEKLLDSILNWIIDNKRWCDIVDFFAPCQLYNSDLCQRAYLKCHDLIPMEQLIELCEAEDQRRHTGEVENHPLIDALYAQNIG